MYDKLVLFTRGLSLLLLILLHEYLNDIKVKEAPRKFKFSLPFLLDNACATICIKNSRPHSG